MEHSRNTGRKEKATIVETVQLQKTDNTAFILLQEMMHVKERRVLIINKNGGFGKREFVKALKKVNFAKRFMQKSCKTHLDVHPGSR